jgi:hypothetical protein
MGLRENDTDEVIDRSDRKDPLYAQTVTSFEDPSLELGELILKVRADRRPLPSRRPLRARASAGHQALSSAMGVACTYASARGRADRCADQPRGRKPIRARPAADALARRPCRPGVPLGARARSISAVCLA